MVAVSDAGIESNKQWKSSSASPFTLLNCILGAIAFICIVLSVIFIILFISSANTAHQVEKELERIKGRNREDGRGENNEPLTCAWMRECRKTRSGVPPLLVISMDGFANNYISWQSTPNIKKMGECGGRAEYMYPSFPSKTFPNHYTIATGLYPGSHGIVDNSFYTPNGTKYNSNIGDFYGGEPIWNTVVRNGKEARTFMWLGSYDKIDGVEASFHQMAYNGTIAYVSRIDQVTDWLSSDDPPALSMLYLEDPDKTGHKYGPDSEEIRQEAITMDGLVQYILRKLSKAGVLGCTNIILVSDHGMANIKKTVDLKKIDAEYNTATTSVGNNVLFYTPVSTEPLKCKKGESYRVYRTKEEVPIRFHYDHENIGFPYVLGNPGTMFMRNETELEKFKKSEQNGNHGWDNMDTQMQAIFYAMGPSIKRDALIAPFQNINLYNLFADLMEIPAAPNNGTKGLLDDLLENPPNRENPFEGFDVKPCEKVSFNDCGSSDKKFSLSNTTGFLSSNDDSICSISTGKLFLLYSRKLNKAVGMEVQVKKTGSYEGKVQARLNGEVIGPGCIEGTGRSVLSGLVPESALKLTWTNFTSLSLVDKAVNKLASKKNVRIQIGFIYGSDGSNKSIFVSGFWCEGDGWRKEKDYCIKEKDSKTESYVIPESAVKNFNCLTENALLFDYRTTLADVEKLSGLSLLPKTMSLSMRRRISLFIAAQKFA